jgi:hypothetical protein
VRYRIVQPWGDRAGEWTLIDERAKVLEAFAAIDALREPMMRTGARSDAIELIVVDDTAWLSHVQTLTDGGSCRLPWCGSPPLARHLVG